jgi:hypothetical protein
MRSTSVFSLAALSAGVSLLLAGAPAWAASVTDSHGNVAYDSAEECDAAVRAGTAKFYKSFTTKPAFKRARETSVKVMRLADVPAPAGDYKLGACDLGARHQANRDGVAPALQGKYVPISPDFLVNVYYNKAGQPVRTMMKQCDNWFSGPFPRPLAAAPARKVSAAPAVVPAPVPAPVVAAPAPAPVQAAAKPVAAPAPAPAAAARPVPTPAPTPAPVAPKVAAAAAKGSVFNVPTTLTLLGFAAAGAAVLSHQDNDPGTTGGAGTTGTTGTSGTTGTR